MTPIFRSDEGMESITSGSDATNSGLKFVGIHIFAFVFDV
jgi:hypothetical protein